MTSTPKISQNGSAQNGHVAVAQGRSASMADTFERPVILRQSPRWARYVVWGIVGVTVSTITWACLAKIEQAIPAQGKLEPRGVVQPVQAPEGGIIKEIHVQEGESVEQGQLLITLDPTPLRAQLEALQEVRKSLVAENNDYARVQSGDISGAPDSTNTSSPELFNLTGNRSALIEENTLYDAILREETRIENLSPEQRRRLQASLGDLNARRAINNLEVMQLREELAQVQDQLANARLALTNSESALATAEGALETEQVILGRITPLVDEGAIAELQQLRQEQEVERRTQDVSNFTQEVNNNRTQISNLQKEEDRLNFAIVQALEQGAQTNFVGREELLDRMAANSNQIANIDAQLNKIVVENNKRIEEIDGELSRLQFALDNQELRAPLTGQVFNLQANQPGYVANATEPILEIVPNDTLVARVFITNRDIGFVTQRFYEERDEPLKVDVRIDSFPFSEFGDVEGEVIHIGSDALPPDQINPFYRFPTEIELESQMLGDTLPLQSGMSVTANIKLRKVRVITILTDLFVRRLDSLRTGG